MQHSNTFGLTNSIPISEWFMRTKLLFMRIIDIKYIKKVNQLDKLN